MDEKEKEVQEFDLEDIMREFSGEEDQPQEAEAEEAVEAEAQEVTGDTVRLDLPLKKQAQADMSDTIRLDGVNAQEEPAPSEPAPAADQTPLPEKAEPYSEDWEPEYEQPMGEYVPPKPIVFQPRSQLRELKRKLVAGPERRYYEINEIGFGKLQMAILLSFLVVAFSVGATVFYAMGVVQASRIKLMVFVQFLTMLISAALGCYQMMEGVSDLLRGRFTLNTMLVLTFFACCVDGVFGLIEQRIPCCAAFSLQVTMSLWGAYQKRSTEMAQMDTLRKAVKLGAITQVGDYHDGCDGLLRGEGKLEDFMDNYKAPSGPEKVLDTYALIALLVSVALGAVSGVIHSSVSFGVQVLAVSLLAAVPVTSFITLSRPMAILEKRLHKMGAVLCGWQGIRKLKRRVLFPLDHEDLFPAGACKLNGVKFYGQRDPDQVVAYSTALITADGGGLVPLFESLLTNRNGRHYEVESFRSYDNGGIGGEVCGEPVLMGSLPFLRDMGVEIPEGISINQAVYTAIDGDLCGVFAIAYTKVRESALGLSALCSYRSLRPVLTTGDLMLTEPFLKHRFSVNTRRICFPERSVRQELREKEIPEDACALALVTAKGLVPYAYAVTGAQSVRTASVLGMVIHLIGGILGLAMMVVLGLLGEAELLTPVNMMLYELVWLVPGLLITEWTRPV